MPIELVEVDYGNAVHARDLCQLLSSYAEDPMGGGKPLDPAALQCLPDRLAAFPTAFSFLAYDGDAAAGLINCFFGFSTFAARRLVNIHDVVVKREFRGRGISRLMFDRVEAVAREKDCCRLTLEVLDKNDVAVAAYRKFGFAGYELDPAAGQAVFMIKDL